ncbi:MAG: DUF222 domain-containing protein [Gammaproteobacteria bacterium]|nr:DUF222 domain-containing protein [Gammaproteobacteria bacterium]
MPETAALPTRDGPNNLQTLADQITELSAHIHAATWRLLMLIREFDEREGWECPGLKSCAHWLNWQCGIALGAAREKVRVAHALEDLPRISEAFRTGRLSFSKVRAMTRVATPDNEDYLLMIADHGTAAHVERLVRGYRSVKRIEALEAENDRHDRRALSWHFDDDGSLEIKGRLTPEQGARVMQALQAAMDAESRERPDVSAETPIAARRADALEQVAESFLAGADTHSTGGDRCTVHVHTDLDTLRADGAGAQAELASGGHVSAETSRRLACDSGVVQWLESADGSTLDVGRRTRSIPPSIRRALERRDQGCRFPGCTTHRFVDAHHIRHWADGGETRLDNLVLLCRHHHRLVHEGGYAVEMQSSDTPVFTDPHGDIIRTGPDTRFRGNVFAITAHNRMAGLAIGSKTPVPDWDGEAMDDSMAVEGLLHRD